MSDADRAIETIMVSPDNPKPWRIENALHLKGARFQFRSWVRPGERWDHDHCVGCWAKFAEFDRPNIQHKGYATRGRIGELWVCRECFDDLKDDLGWKLE